MTPQRRRSPQWVRDMSDRTLHAVAFKLRHHQETEDLTPKEEWLWSALISELEYRARSERRRPRGNPCVCELCFQPFDDDRGGEDSEREY